MKGMNFMKILIKKKILIVSLFLFVALFIGCGSNPNESTKTNEKTTSNLDTVDDTKTPTSVSTPTLVETPTPSDTPTPVETPTPVVSPIPSETPTPTVIEVKYTIVFRVNEVDLVIQEVLENEMPNVPTDTLSYSDDQYDYNFIGWEPSVTVATQDQVYVAKYEKVAKKLIYSSLDGLKLSILGDSISTYYNNDNEPSSYYHSDNTYYYPKYCKEIDSYTKTWWGQLLNNTNMVLGINNSWSGTTASDQFGNSGASSARIKTLNENGDMDIFIYYLGTNDLVNGLSETVFRNAVTKTIKQVKELCNTQVYVVTLGYSAYSSYGYTDEGRIKYNEVLRELASDNGWGVIPLDEYVVEDNYSIYLADRLHYNLKGTTLLAKVVEKSIKEFNGIEFNEDIEVLHNEPLGSGVIGKITATASSGFWSGTNYAENIYLYNINNGEGESALYSTRIILTKNGDDYYVSKIIASGTSASSYDGDYVIMISDAYSDLGTVKYNIQNVKVGNLAEFDVSNGFPVEITFKDGNSTIEDPNEGGGEVVSTEGLVIGSYNTGVWTLYETTVMAYSGTTIDKNSTYINFYVIGINKVSDNEYRVDYLKPYGEATNFGDYLYYILIYNELESKSYYEGLKIGDKATVDGDIESGNALVKFN